VPGLRGPHHVNNQRDYAAVEAELADRARTRIPELLNRANTIEAREPIAYRGDPAREAIQLRFPDDLVGPA
jgi:hypothetical protein